jgi:hypothetical protein
MSTSTNFLLTAPISSSLRLCVSLLLCFSASLLLCFSASPPQLVLHPPVPKLQRCKIGKRIGCFNQEPLIRLPILKVQSCGARGGPQSSNFGG